jgi:hypothetical protein
MLVDKLNERLLRVVQCAKRLTVYKLNDAMNRLVSMFSLIRDILACYQVKLQRVKFLSKKLREQGLI